jgi:hypothetical protein
VRLLVLSDHTANQIHKAKQSREGQYLAAMEEYGRAKERLRHRRESATRALRSAFAERRIWATLRGLCEWVAARRANLPGAPIMPRADRQETVWAAGHEGEQLILDQLAYQLSDEWTVITGYRNHKGEIDMLAVGPDGIMALEIKHLNGVVHCNGDQWYRDKYDKYGNLVDRDIPIADNGGRAPSRQLNEAANALQAFLQKRGVNGHVLRVVVLSHGMSRIGNLHNQTVDWICTANYLNPTAYCRGRCNQNSPDEVDTVISLVRQDHAYSNKPRTGTYRSGAATSAKNSGLRPQSSRA